MILKLSELRLLVKKALQEMAENMEEDHTAHSLESGYSNEIEEDYDMDEASLASPPKDPQSAQSSAGLHTRDKSQMQGVGPRPNIKSAFGEPKKEGAQPSAEEQQMINTIESDVGNHGSAVEVSDGQVSVYDNLTGKMVAQGKTVKDVYNQILNTKEGVSQSKRAKHGYKGEAPIDYVTESLDGIEESAATEKAEEFVKKHKKDFIKRYGEKEGIKNLYATANKKFKKK